VLVYQEDRGQHRIVVFAEEGGFDGPLKHCRDRGWKILNFGKAYGGLCHAVKCMAPRGTE